MPTPPLSGRRVSRGVILALTLGLGAASLVSLPAAASGPGHGNGEPRPRADLLQNCTGTSPIVCVFADLAPGNYDVTVLLGAKDTAADTAVQVESRRLIVDEVRTEAGDLQKRSFTVNVRDPEGQQNQPVGTGTPGLTITFGGTAPRVAGIGVSEASRHTVRVALIGDSTVTDQETAPYAGWGQRLPAAFGRGVSVVNHSGSGESTVSTLAKPELFAALEPQLQRVDVALIQLAHNDKTTTAEQYRANLRELVARVTARGATPVLVTPIVRHRFEGDRLNSVGLIVTDQADLPAEIRAVAAELAVPLIDLTARSQQIVESLGPVDSEPIYLIRENGDRTHTSEYGASVYAGVVAEELRTLGLLPRRGWNDGHGGS